MGNSKGGYYSKRENTMAAYDRLPASVRSALQVAAFNWAPQPIRTMFERGRYSAPQIVKEIKKWDAKHIARDRKRVWGLDH